MVSKKATLSLTQANAICEKLVPLVDKSYEKYDALCAHGFRAFTAYTDYIESFGNPEEIALHRRIVIEGAKTNIASPSPFIPNVGESKYRYESALLNELRRALWLRKGVSSEHELIAKYPNDYWKWSGDPCQERKLLAEWKERCQPTEGFLRIQEAKRNFIEDEAEQKRSGDSKLFHFSHEGRIAFYNYCFEKYSADLGFHFDEKRSKAHYPIYIKPVAPGWSLAFYVESWKELIYLPLKGELQIRLILLADTAGGNIDRLSQGKLMEIHYHQIVYGFSESYWYFFSLDEMEVIIMAYLYLYEICSSDIEIAITSVLGT